MALVEHLEVSPALREMGEGAAVEACSSKGLRLVILQPRRSDLGGGKAGCQMALSALPFVLKAIHLPRAIKRQL